MVSASRGRRRFREQDIRSSPASSNLSAMACTDGQRNPMLSLRSLLVFSALAVVGYVAWRTNFSAEDSSAANREIIYEESRRIAENVAVYSVDVVREYSHDPDAFTQGLLYYGNDTLFESTGLYGKSSVRKVNLQTGKVTAITKMDRRVFGEGLTLLRERLYQVTWLTRTGFIYDQKTLKKLNSFTHEMDDGWGLATDGKIIFGSDGSPTLYQINPNTMKVINKTDVTYNGQSILYLNELEYINGEVWANIWETDCIARISPRDGKVVGWIFLHNLRENIARTWNGDFDVLNGIAWDKEKNRIFVTGKQWPKLYEIKLRKIVQPLNATVESICRLRTL